MIFYKGKTCGLFSFQDSDSLEWCGMIIVLCCHSIFFVAVLGIELRTSHMLVKHSSTELYLQPFVLLGTGPKLPKLSLNVDLPLLASWRCEVTRLYYQAQLNSLTFKKWFFPLFSLKFLFFQNIINTNLRPQLLSAFFHNWSEYFSLKLTNGNMWWTHARFTQNNIQHPQNLNYGVLKIDCSNQ